MRGSITRKRKGVWRLIVDAPPAYDAATGGLRRRQKWVTFHGTEKQAQAKLTELVSAVNNHTYVESSRLAIGEYLDRWLEQSIRPLRRARTYDTYRTVVRRFGRSGLGAVPIQQLTASALEKYYAEMKAKPATIGVHHAVIRCALEKAVRDRLVVRNVARDSVERPKLTGSRAREQCWTAMEARRFLTAARSAGAQAAAFFALALDSGLRKSELAGLTWPHADLDAGRLRVAQQLLRERDAEGGPVFGPTKTGHVRDVTLGIETVRLLREHKRQQAALKLKNRTTYEDHALLFAKEPADLQTPAARLGQAVSIDRLALTLFRRLTGEASVKRITFHGLRHTCATLLLQAGQPVHVVAQRLGHANAAMTLNVYAHALPDQQADAAERLGAVLHGR